MECGTISTSGCRKSVYLSTGRHIDETWYSCWRPRISEFCDEILRIVYTAWNATQYRWADVVNQSICQRVVISTKPDTLVEDRGPSNLRRNSKNYLHRLECGAISMSGCRKSVYICQRDIISKKPDTPVKDRGPRNLRRNSENYLHRLECGAISTSWCRKSVYICQRDIISTKPDTPVEDRGPRNLRRNSKNYLHRLECGAISTSGCRKSVCLSTGRHINETWYARWRSRAFNLTTKFCLPHINFDATSTSGYKVKVSSINNATQKPY